MSFKSLSLLNNNLIISISNPCVLRPQLSHSPIDASCHQEAFISSIQSSLYDLTLCLSLQGGGKFPSLATDNQVVLFDCFDRNSIENYLFLKSSL